MATATGFGAAGAAASGRKVARHPAVACTAATAALAGTKGPMRTGPAGAYAAGFAGIPGIPTLDATWFAESVPPELDWLRIAVRAWLDLDVADLGIKGSESHRSGYHRSRAWLLAHGQADDYSLDDPRDADGGDDNWLCALDVSLPTAVLIAACQRLMAASIAGTLPPQVREWFGTVDGVTVTGWDTVDDAEADSDPSHLSHLHLGLFRSMVDEPGMAEALLALIVGEERMSSFIFNISGGREVHFAREVAAGNGAWLVVLLRGAQSDGNLREHDDLASLLANASNIEATFTNYARKSITSAGATYTVVDADNWTDIDVADQTWAAAGGAVNNTLVKLVVCYEPTGAVSDADRIPVAGLDYAATTDGTALVWQPPADGFARAAA